MESKYYKWNKRGSRIIIDSGYKTFDNYIVCISRGNVVGGGQTSFYIRPYNEITCNGKTFEKGHLRNYDLSMFSGLDYEVRKYVESITTNQSCVLYKFYTYKHGIENQVGYIVEQNGNFKIFNNSYYSKNKKQKCLEFITKILQEKYEIYG
ncbi:MAG: hypothetical protein IKC22_00785 [Bacilli bacterium]|nr:hypothetical protein [bacterium]MBR2890918.1 hypothetical protein [Bacilli bacterium]